MEGSPPPQRSDTVISLLTRTAEFLTQHCPDTPWLDAEVLLAHVLGSDKTGLYIAPYRLLSEQEQAQLKVLIARRIKGEPVSYIIGRKEFWSLRFKVTPAVMIPRPQTETLVEEALRICPPGSSPSILDLGTGSGAIAIALATELPSASIIATDISLEALGVAQENAVARGVSSITFMQGDLYEPLKIKHKVFDVIVSNPPYISTDEIPYLPAGIRDYEPRAAFDGGADGLEYYRQIAHEGHLFLKSGGYLLLEAGDKQSQDVCAIILATGNFLAPEAKKDLLGVERIIKARRC